jgi:hypothetical protein
MTDYNQLKEFINNLKERQGERPKTVGPAPHTQIDQYPDKGKFADDLFEFVVGFPDVQNGISHIGDGGLRAFFILSENHRHGLSDHFLVDNEFAHIHKHGSHSLHVVLPFEIGKTIEAKKWGENHPFAIEGRIPETNFMLYGARNADELEVQKKLLEISYLFATNQWV